MDLSKIKDKLGHKIITRYAPSPTGDLHRGHVASALYVWGLASLLGAKVIVRIEDHDGDRSKKEYEKSILEDLEWLGFLSRPETLKVIKQSDESELYSEALKTLIGKNLVYPCSCSRKALQKRQKPSSKELYYDGLCSKIILEGQKNVSLRLKTSKECQSFFDLGRGVLTQNIQEQCGDFVLKDRKGYWSYQFSSVVSDLASSVNFIIRGDDILESTGRQVYLRKALGASREVIFFHHPLIMNKNSKEKLSKSEGAEAIKEARFAQKSPALVLGESAALLGLIQEPRDLFLEEMSTILKKNFQK